MRRVEPHEVVLGSENERQRLVLVLQVYHHADLFCLQIQDAVAEVNEDEAQILLVRVLVLFPDEEAMLELLAHIFVLFTPL